MHQGTQPGAGHRKRQGRGSPLDPPGGAALLDPWTSTSQGRMRHFGCLKALCLRHFVEAATANYNSNVGILSETTDFLRRRPHRHLEPKATSLTRFPEAAHCCRPLFLGFFGVQ